MLVRKLNINTLKKKMNYTIINIFLKLLQKHYKSLLQQILNETNQIIKYLKTFRVFIDY